VFSAARLILFLFLAISSALLPPWAAAQAPPTSTAAGFRQYQGKHLTLITDLPHTETLGQLCAIFDAAMPQWGAFFGIEERYWSKWQCTGYMIGDRNRFQEAGYFPATLPPFVYGYQLEDQVWCMDQPSDYYRRHLLLHEGTHWFMARALGNAGPPWYMEGIAEYLATHRWVDSQLQMAVFPDKREGFEYWGRMLVIRKQRGQVEQPSLEAILRYGPTAHQKVDAYAWSWAAIWFLKNHPRSKEALDGLQKAKMVDPNSLTPRLLARLRPHWQEITTSWNAWVQQLDYGGDLTRDLPLIDEQKKVSGNGPYQLSIDTERGWQDTGIRVMAGQRITLEAKGRYQVGQEPKPWWCEPEGVTIEYFAGQPLGRLVALIAQPDSTNSSSAQGATEFMAIGAKASWEAKTSGVLLMKINEPSNRLGDNEGTVQVTVTLQ
jgi:hypothetical protein